MYTSVVFIPTMLLCTGSPVFAFNPQLEPQANTWKVEGYIDMTALEIMPASDMTTPFGVDVAIIGDGRVDFHAEIIATFTATDYDGDLMPDDGFYTPTMRFFDVFMGNAQWDETMFSPDLEFQVQSGLVTGWRCTLTTTMPSHPDLEFKFPSSPGTWIAIDERNDINLGTNSGIYSLRDGIVYEAIDFPWHLFYQPS